MNPSLRRVQRTGSVLTTMAYVGFTATIVILSVGATVASRVSAEDWRDFRCQVGHPEPGDARCITRLLAAERARAEAERLELEAQKQRLEEDQRGILRSLEESRREQEAAAGRLVELAALERRLGPFDSFTEQVDRVSGQTVTTGVKMSSLIDQTVISQWCYARVRDAEGRGIHVQLANADGAGKVSLSDPHAPTLAAVKLTDADFKRLQTFCRFRGASS